jgi:3'-phosphoadenosine 5'-phosphosulfate sulfotransferase (PAPS reductase)/FAD synthetase
MKLIIEDTGFEEPRDYLQEPLQVFSCGMGVQSCAMAIMIKKGILPKPDIGIFADTGAEKPESIKLLHDFMIPLFKELNIPFYVVQSHHGRIDDYYKERGSIPMIGFRHCTDKFKISPIRKFIRSIVGNRYGKHLATSWLGITIDENHREFKSDVKWIQNKFPLLELSISRDDCYAILEEANLEVVKSGCFMCPYNSGGEWLRLRDGDPVLWQRALDLEAAHFAKWPDRWKGLRSDNLKLTDPMGKFSQTSCDSGGCFI